MTQGQKWLGDRCPADCIYSMKATSTEGNPHRHCGFILRAGKIRGCEIGPGCTRYDSNRKPGGGRCGWDVARGRILWLQGWTQKAIAKELGTTYASVERRVRLYWKRGVD